MFEQNVHKVLYRQLVGDTALAGLLGAGERVFYRLSERDTALPYICYAVRIEDGVADAEKFGLLTIDIWTYITTSTLSYAIEERLWNMLHNTMVNNRDLKATRLYHKNSFEASVENNRSNRRSEDERIHRREMIFMIRGWDQQQALALINRFNPAS